MAQNISLLIGGLLFMVLALAFAPTLLSFAATAGSGGHVGSFSGVRNMNDLIPLTYYMGVVIGGLTAMGIGGAGLAGRGPGKGFVRS